MENWMIVASVIVGLLLIGSMFLVNIVTADEQESNQIDCSTCGNSCSLESNCGLASCGAVSGGSCGCGE